MCEIYCLAAVEFRQERRSRKRLGGCVNGVILSPEPPNRIICCIGFGNLSKECLDELVLVVCAKDSCAACESACTDEDNSCIICDVGWFSIVDGGVEI